MLLGKKEERGGLSPILFSLGFLITNKKTFYPTEHRFISKKLKDLSVCFSNRTSREYQFVPLIEHQGIFKKYKFNTWINFTWGLLISE